MGWIIEGNGSRARDWKGDEYVWYGDEWVDRKEWEHDLEAVGSVIHKYEGGNEHEQRVVRILKGWLERERERVGD